MSEIITCPSCKTDIDLGKITEDKYRLQLEADFEKERDEMRKKSLAFAEQKMQEATKKNSLEMEDLKNRLKEGEKKEQDFQRQELEMRKKQRELEEKEKNRELELAKKLDEERVKLQAESDKKSAEDKKILEEEMGKSQEEAIKKQVEEQKKIDEEMVRKVQEDFRKKELEYQKQQDQMKKALDDANRKAGQGSQQIQGDIQEEDLKQSLQMAFPIDRIEDVPTGIKGADIIQGVKNSLGQETGVIIWESKNTKAWQDTWISKLKDDKVVAKASIAILITTVLPKGLEKFGMINDVMVTLPEYALHVVSLLRDRLISVSKVEKSLQGKDVKMEMLYSYLTSEEFGSKVNGIIDAFENLKLGIDTEKRAMERIWKKREKELERVIMTTSMMQGDFEGIIGQVLPGGERLSLDEGEE
ncbi:DUF2130 domain-containing protein [Candidatus Gracilibacteria bacterium]|nr:DUF2130 domain-containing protein [Candidatus Gracilibacteria bacterium]